MMIYRTALFFLVFMFTIVLSFTAGRYEVFPYSLVSGFINDLEAYIRGADGEETTLFEKFKNDLNIKPTRFIFEHKTGDKRTYKELELPNKTDRRDNPNLFIPEAKDKNGYYFISGVFDFNNSLHGAILLSQTGALLHQWTYKYDIEAPQNKTHVQARRPLNQLPFGTKLLPDGGVVVSTNWGQATQKFNWCSNIDWSLEGDFHHFFGTSDDLTRAWMWQDYAPNSLKIVEVDITNGTIVRSISMNDVMTSNPQIDIFGLKQRDTHAQWLHDPWHPNDIEPLPSKLAAKHPLFDTGDLLISFRSLNLIFVLDPDTLKIKWWRVGLTRRQHDPDWHSSGLISVFDNNMNRKTSRITLIDPISYQGEILYDGYEENIYSSEGGDHTVLPNGNILLVSQEQGRVLEVSAEGDIVFEFLNIYNRTKNERLIVTSAHWLPTNFFNLKDMPACIN